MNHVNTVNALKREFKKSVHLPPPPPHSYRNSRNYLSVLALLLVTLFSACPVYDQPYFEFRFTDRLSTNIRIAGEYVPQKGDKPVVLFYLDNTYDDGFVNDAGEVVLEGKGLASRQGKIFYRLYLRDIEKSILLGRRFDGEAVVLKVDASGAVHFQEKVVNPNDVELLYTPRGSVEEFIQIGSSAGTRDGAYVLTNEL
ncbi:MAG: hypothetical protein LBC67_01075, partial [Spirochaetales bacterium]|nr:hypothetical protein [Spirochaetales bacterium]